MLDKKTAANLCGFFCFRALSLVFDYFFDSSAPINDAINDPAARMFRLVSN